jgi:hypothetical protein
MVEQVEDPSTDLARTYTSSINLVGRDVTREPLPRHLVEFITSRQGFLSIILMCSFFWSSFDAGAHPFDLAIGTLQSTVHALGVAMLYRHFSFARRMALPPRSQAALASQDGGAEETLPHALRPLGADLRVLIASFESLYTMNITRRDPSEDVSAMQSAELDLWQWMSTMDSLEAQAKAEALDRGASLDTLRSLLAKHVTPGSMTQAAGLVLSPSARPSVLDRLLGRATRLQIKHVRAVIMELRRIEEALHTDTGQPYR